MILHADADAFFASVEQRDDPRLRGRPMVVAHEVVACPSYEARALGIHAGMSLRQVQRRWPEVLVTGYRSEAYEEASARLFEVFRRFTPLVEPGSVEEAFLDVTGRDRGDPGGMAAALRSAARDEVGLPVSVGVGRTKLMAKLASRRAKPDGLVVVDAALEAHVRPRLRLDELWGVGPDDLTEAPRRRAFRRRRPAWPRRDRPQAHRHHGHGTAPRLDRGRHGRRDDPPPGATSVSEREPVVPRDPDAVEGRRGARRVRRPRRHPGAHPRGPPRLPRRLEVLVRYDDGTQVLERGPLDEPTLDPADLRTAAGHLLERTAYEWDGRGVTMVGVTLPLPMPS